MQRYILNTQKQNKFLSLERPLNKSVMKKFLVFTIILFSYSVKATQIQIDFVSTINIDIINVNPLSPSEGSATSNSAINLIFSNHNVNHCVNTFNNPYDIIIVEYTGNNFNSFKNDLLANINVSNVRICHQTINNVYNYADRLYIQLLNGNNGNPILNGSTITTNSALNTIFSNYNVDVISQVIPSSSTWYLIYFQGDITSLKAELENLNTVISSTNLVGVAMLLQNTRFEKSKTIISPNPFSDNFNIETENIISKYSLIDISGKQIVSTNSKQELDAKTQSLNAGFYVLNLTFDSGEISNHKLVKK